MSRATTLSSSTTKIFSPATCYPFPVVSSAENCIVKVVPAPPDLILLDVMMPDLNGYEVTRLILPNLALP